MNNRKVGEVVAYGGNWFFISHLPVSLEISNVGELTRATQAIQNLNVMFSLPEREGLA